MQNKSSYYAPYFGLDIGNLRKWIEIQFEDGMNWANFSKSWQFDHIVPLAYFDFEDQADLRLCWNFTNIKAEKLARDKKETRVTGRLDLLGSKAYFSKLFERTHYQICREMVSKIEKIEAFQLENAVNLGKFMVENSSYLESISTFSYYEFLSLNEGTGLEQIKKDREFLKRFE